MGGSVARGYVSDSFVFSMLRRSCQLQVAMAAAVYLGFVMAEVGISVQHDANHGAFSQCASPMPCDALRHQTTCITTLCFYHPIAHLTHATCHQRLASETTHRSAVSTSTASVAFVSRAILHTVVVERGAESPSLPQLSNRTPVRGPKQFKIALPITKVSSPTIRRNRPPMLCAAATRGCATSLA